jgi:hypothetical protein
MFNVSSVSLLAVCEIAGSSSRAPLRLCAPHSAARNLIGSDAAMRSDVTGIRWPPLLCAAARVRTRWIDQHDLAGSGNHGFHLLEAGVCTPSFSCLKQAVDVDGFDEPIGLPSPGPWFRPTMTAK